MRLSARNNFLRKLIRGRRTPLALFTFCKRSAYTHMRVELVRAPCCPGEVLDELHSLYGDKYDYWIAVHPNTSADTLRRIAKREQPGCVGVILGRVDVPIDIIETWTASPIYPKLRRIARQAHARWLQRTGG